MQWCLPFVLWELSFSFLLASARGWSPKVGWLRKLGWGDSMSVSVLLVWGGDGCFEEDNFVVSTLTVLGADVVFVIKVSTATWGGLVVGFSSVQFVSSKRKKHKIPIIQHVVTILELRSQSWVKMNEKKIPFCNLFTD